MIGLIVCAGMFSGCCHFSCRTQRASPLPLPASVAAEFASGKTRPSAAHETDLAAKDGYAVTRIDLPAFNDRLRGNRTIALDFYLPEGSDRRPVILVLPTAGGSYQIESHFASYFARHGLAAVIVHRPEKFSGLIRLETIDALFKQSVRDHKLVLDWIETRPELDTGRIGVFGVSLGAIQGALLTPLDPRVRAAVLGLTGGDLPYLLTYSTESGVSRRRREILREHKLTLPELHRKLEATITCDPDAFAAYVDPKEVLLVLAFCDTTVPYKKGWELREKMGKPETILLPTGHFTALLYLPYIQRQAREFFQKKLN